MKRAIILGLGMLALGAAPVLAADIPVKVARPAPVMAAAAYNWTGIYTASSVGGQWWNIDSDYTNAAPNQHNTSGSRWSFGSRLGAQYQWQNVVLGIEGGYNHAFQPDLTSSNSIGPDCLGATGPADRTCSSRIRNYWMVGAKLGWAWDNWMVYGIGGYANGRIDTQTTVTSTGVLTSLTSERHPGWYVGGGIDVFVTKLWFSDLIIGFEYMHVDLQSRLHVDELDPTVPATARINNRNVRATDDVFRLKITSKFNFGTDAVVAKY